MEERGRDGDGDVGGKDGGEVRVGGARGGGRSWTFIGGRIQE